MTSPKLLAILATALTLCSGCGGTPTRSEFVDKVVDDGSKELGSMTSSGISDGELKKILGVFAGCVYDEVKDNADDLDTVVNETDSDKVNTLIDQKAPACKESFTTALQDAVTGAAQAGG